MRMRVKEIRMRTWLWMTILLPLVACTEKIDIELDDTYTRLVVEGGITDQPGPHTVRLSLSGDYFENAPPRMAGGASVSLFDGEVSHPLTEVSPGIYQTDAGLQGIPGTTYTLYIDGVEIDGVLKSYEASSFLPQVPPIDSIRVELNPNWEIWAVQLYATDPPERNFYMFRIYRNGQLMSDTLDEWVVTNDDLFNGNYTYGIMVQWLEMAEAAPGDTITLELAGITEEYANFIWGVQDETGFNSPLFSGPPANVLGNVTNGAIGFFHAYGTVRASTVIR